LPDMEKKEFKTADNGEKAAPSFLTGVYLAVNAVSDAYIVVDGTDCVVRKAECVYASHDLFSTLLDCRGASRVLHTRAHAKEILAGDGSVMEAEVRALRGRAGVVLVSSLPVMSMTGRDYKRLAGMLNGKTGARVVDVSGNSMDRDFLDGYSLAFEKIAEDMELKKGLGKPKKIALAGYFMDRTEGDHTGNLAELRRMLSLLGIELVCVWPDGGEYSELRKIEGASVIVSLPYARAAAEILARKTGAALLPLGIPLGFGGSAAWLRAVAEAAGVSGKVVSAVLGRELASAHGLARLAVGGGLAGKRVCFTGDPYLGEAFCAFAGELGMIIAGVCLSCAGGQWAGAENIFSGRLVLRDFRVRTYSDAVMKLFSRGGCDLLVSNSIGRRSELLSLPGLDLGFPSYRYHALLPAPFAGFRGAVNLVGRLFNALRSA